LQHQGNRTERRFQLCTAGQSRRRRSVPDIKLLASPFLSPSPAPPIPPSQHLHLPQPLRRELHEQPHFGRGRAPRGVDEMHGHGRQLVSLEPLPVGVDQAEQRHRRSAHLRGQGGQRVEQRLGPGAQHPQRAQPFEPALFAFVLLVGARREGPQRAALPATSRIERISSSDCARRAAGSPAISTVKVTVSGPRPSAPWLMWRQPPGSGCASVAEK